MDNSTSGKRHQKRIGRWLERLERSQHVGMVPIPFQTAMLAAGAAGYPVWKFVLAATLARGIRYFGLAWLVFVLGKQTVILWQNHRLIVGLDLAIIVVALWALTQWLSSVLI